MRDRLSLFTLCLCLLLVLVGGSTVQAQMQSLSERNSFWQTEPSINMPVTICHIPPGNPGNAHTIEVGQAAVAAHMAHGDLMGECPYECDGPASPVPQTGQTASWGSRDDGELQMGVPSPDPRFTDNGDGTVTDNLTHLIWLKNANCFGHRRWTDALSDANGLADGSCGLWDGSVAGDWRLPNVRELLSLIDFGKYYPGLPPGHLFSGVQSVHYWSSTSSANTQVLAWRVHLGNNGVSNYSKLNPYYVWPVRGPE